MDTKQLYRAKPFFPEEDKKEIKSKWEEILDTGMFIQGKHVAKLEEEFASYCDTKYAIATNSGATALEVALRATGIENKKFIVPTQTFVASVSAIIRSNNIPVITDINPETQCLDLEIIKQNIDDQTAGIMWVHMAGLISPDYLEIKKYCDEKGLIILEDASHAVGSSMKGHKAGNLGLAGCFSLFATKIITSGEGGMITTNDEKFAEECRILRNHGSVRNDGNVKGLDYGVNCTYASSNYRMVETSAVVGLTQLRRADEFVHKRNLIADRYKAKLSSKLFLPPVNEDTKMTWWQYIIILPKSFSRQDRENFAKELLEKYKIPTANAYWPACHDQPAFKSYVNPNQQYKNADDILDRHLSLPMYFEMDLEQVDYVAESVNELLCL